VGGVNYVYDNGGAGTGNVTSDGGHSYQYDGENRLVKVDSGTTAINTYDAANRRVKKVAGGATTWYVWEGGEVIAEYGAVPVGASNIRYYHPDRLSTRMITDSMGAVVGTQDHLPFGEDAGVVGENEKHRFTNYERDAESGTDYAVNRQYSTSTGRFLRPDPVAGGIGNPQSFNRYSYTLNDPTNLTDPEGLLPNLAGAILNWWYSGTKGSTSVSAGGWDTWINPIPAGFFSLTPIGGQGGDLRQGGIDAAKKALERPPCRDYIKGQFGQDPLALLEKLAANGQFSPGDPNDKEFQVGKTYSPAYTKGTGENAKIVYDPGINTPTLVRTGFSGWAERTARIFNLTFERAVGFGFLHELSHATGRTVHPAIPGLENRRRCMLFGFKEIYHLASHSF
jgi:RHS repeat-associated protein